jgi:hypothetical protein
VEKKLSGEADLSFAPAVGRYAVRLLEALDCWPDRTAEARDMAATRVPTLSQLHWARRAYERNDLGDLFYRAATDLVGRVRKRQSALTLAEALAVLLQSWNASFYRFRGGFSGRDLRR